MLDEVRGKFIGTMKSVKYVVKANVSIVSDCGKVGRAFPIDTRGPQFESSHRQLYLLSIVLKLFRKDENKEKRGR